MFKGVLLCKGATKGRHLTVSGCLHSSVPYFVPKFKNKYFKIPLGPCKQFNFHKKICIRGKRKLNFQSLISLYLSNLKMSFNIRGVPSRVRDVVPEYKKSQNQPAP